MQEEVPIVSKKDVMEGLIGLGLKKGDIVGIHASLSSFGHIRGGANTVIDALFEILGSEGTIVMSTHSANIQEVEMSREERELGLLWKLKILPYDPEKTPCTTGIIPETFRKRKNVLRSKHMVHSIASTGLKAGEIITEAHDRDLGGWKKLCDLDGYILLIGVGFDRCTSMHLAEERVKLPEHIQDILTPPEWLKTKYPDGEWETDFGIYPDFKQIEPYCIKRKIMKITKIGNATIRLVKLQELLDLYVELLRENPSLFYH
ncbi:MAG: aminoglycoside N(3)-acetyltransferase [Candidatus Odinarchaeota archaeon]